MRLSAVLFVEDVLVAELSQKTEFHADCLAQGLFGDLFPVQVYESASDSQKIAWLKGLLQPGNLLTVHDGVVDVCCNALRLMGPNLQPFTGGSEELRNEFVNRQPIRNLEPTETSRSDLDHIQGQVTECRILPTKNAGPMAFATIETTGKVVEAILFPEIFGRYQAIVTRLGVLAFSGKMEPVCDPSIQCKMIVEHVSRS